MTEHFFTAIKELDSKFANELITAIQKGFTVTIVSGLETENYQAKYFQPYLDLVQKLQPCWRELIEQDGSTISRDMQAEDVIIHYLQQHHTKNSPDEEV
jgi:hypothetical protein